MNCSLIILILCVCINGRIIVTFYSINIRIGIEFLLEYYTIIDDGDIYRGEPKPASQPDI